MSVVKALQAAAGESHQLARAQPRLVNGVAAVQVLARVIVVEGLHDGVLLGPSDGHTLD